MNKLLGLLRVDLSVPQWLAWFIDSILITLHYILITTFSVNSILTTLNTETWQSIQFLLSLWLFFLFLTEREHSDHTQPAVDHTPCPLPNPGLPSDPGMLHGGGLLVCSRWDHRSGERHQTSLCFLKCGVNFLFYHTGRPDGGCMWQDFHWNMTHPKVAEMSHLSNLWAVKADWLLQGLLTGLVRMMYGACQLKQAWVWCHGAD